MIEVKGIRSAASTTPSADRYELTEGKKLSRVPMAFGLALAGLALYLKSFLPGGSWSAHAAQNPDGQDDAPTEAPAEEPPGAALRARRQDAGSTGDRRAQPEALGDDSSDTGAWKPVITLGAAGLGAGQLSPADLGVLALASATANFNIPVSPGRFPFIDRDGPKPFDVPFFEFPGRGSVRLVAGAPDEDDDATGGGDGTQTGDDTGPADDLDGEADPDRPGDAAQDDDETTGNCDAHGVRNRAPKSTGPVYLADVGAAATLMIALGDLLAQTDDPDGDALEIKNVTASAGQVTAVEGGWLFSAPQEVIGPVTISFEISDGTTVVPQVAHLNVAPVGGDPAPEDSEGDETGTEGPDSEAGAGDISPANTVIQGGADGDHIVGSAGDDVIFGGQGADVIFGGAGADQISGAAGDDLLYGEGGDDVIFGDDGNDQLFGGDGNDILSGGAGDDSCEGGEGDDILTGGAGDNWLSGGAGGDLLIGGDGDDHLAGDEGNDNLFGEDGDDVLFGGAGDDVISDGQGADRVDGGDGDDRVIAAADRADDDYQGGAGNDTLDYSAATKGVIVDLVAAVATGEETGADAFDGFETYVGGSGDDTFIVGTADASFAGGGGNNLFDFSRASATLLPLETVYQILDFKAGDRLKVSQYDFFKDLKDEIEDQFEDYRDRSFGGDCDDDPKISVRHDATDNLQRTLIEIDANRDDYYEMTISLVGNHLLVVVDHG